MTTRQLREWEDLYLSEPFAADSVEETVGRLGAVIVNMWGKDANASANHFRAIPRDTRQPAKHAEITITDLTVRMGGG